MDGTVYIKGELLSLTKVRPQKSLLNEISTQSAYYELDKTRIYSLAAVN